MGNITAFENVAGSMFNDIDLVGTTDQEIIDLCDGDDDLSEKAVKGLHEYMSEIMAMNPASGHIQSLDDWNSDRLNMSADDWGTTNLIIVEWDNVDNEWIEK